MITPSHPWPASRTWSTEYEKTNQGKQAREILVPAEGQGPAAQVARAHDGAGDRCGDVDGRRGVGG